MAFKFLTFIAFIAVASAVEYHGYDNQQAVYHTPVVHHVAPVVHHAAPVHVAPVAYHAAPAQDYKHEDYPHAPPHYDFSYGVHDEHTGDVKSQQESRKDDAVHGSYSLIDADGYKRTVEYTADDHNGFNAVVHREPTGHVAKVAPVQYAKAPVYAAAPAHYHH